MAISPHQTLKEIESLVVQEIRYQPLYPFIAYVQSQMKLNSFFRIGALEEAIQHFLEHSQTTLDVSEYSLGNFESTIDYQTSNPTLNALTEVISNAIDASGGSIGRFNLGVKQLLSVLRTEGDSILVTSKTKNSPSLTLEIIVRNQIKTICLRHSNKDEAINHNGTRVQVKSALGFDQEKLKERIAYRYENEKNTILFFNGQNLKPQVQTESLMDCEASKQNEYPYPIKIELSQEETVFSVEDYGTGMDKYALLCMFVPGMSGKIDEKDSIHKNYIYLRGQNRVKTDPVVINSVTFSRRGENIFEPISVNESPQKDGLDIGVELNSHINPFESRQNIQYNQLFFEGIKFLMIYSINQMIKWPLQDKVILLNAIYSAVFEQVKDNPQGRSLCHKLSLEIKDQLSSLFESLVEDNIVDYIMDEKFRNSPLLLSEKTLFLHADLIPQNTKNPFHEKQIGYHVSHQSNKKTPIYVVDFKEQEETFSSVAPTVNFSHLPFFKTDEAIYVSSKLNAFTEHIDSELCQGLLSTILSESVNTSYEEKSYEDSFERLRFASTVNKDVQPTQQTKRLPHSFLRNIGFDIQGKFGSYYRIGNCIIIRGNENGGQTIKAIPLAHILEKSRHIEGEIIALEDIAFFSCKSPSGEITVYSSLDTQVQYKIPDFVEEVSCVTNEWMLVKTKLGLHRMYRIGTPIKQEDFANEKKVRLRSIKSVNESWVKVWSQDDDFRLIDLHSMSHLNQFSLAPFMNGKEIETFEEINKLGDQYIYFRHHNYYTHEINGYIVAISELRNSLPITQKAHKIEGIRVVDFICGKWVSVQGDILEKERKNTSIDDLLKENHYQDLKTYKGDYISYPISKHIKLMRVYRQKKGEVKSFLNSENKIVTIDDWNQWMEGSEEDPLRGTPGLIEVYGHNRDYLGVRSMEDKTKKKYILAGEYDYQEHFDHLIDRTEEYKKNEKRIPVFWCIDAPELQQYLIECMNNENVNILGLTAALSFFEKDKEVSDEWKQNIGQVMAFIQSLKLNTVSNYDASNVYKYIIRFSVTELPLNWLTSADLVYFLSFPWKRSLLPIEWERLQFFRSVLYQEPNARRVLFSCLAEGLFFDKIRQVLHNGNDFDLLIKSLKDTEYDVENKTFSDWLKDSSSWGVFLRFLCSKATPIPLITQLSKVEEEQSIYLSQVSIARERWVREKNPKGDFFSYAENLKPYKSVQLLESDKWPTIIRSYDSRVAQDLIHLQRDIGLYPVEYAQNAMDAIPAHQEGIRIDIRVYQSEDYFYEEIEDNSEGPLEPFDLLCEGIGHKYTSKEFLGKFGQGGFVFLDGCDEAEIEVYRDGVIKVIHLKKTSDGLWTVTLIKQFQLSQEYHKKNGLILRRKKSLKGQSFSYLKALEAFHNWSCFAKMIPKDKCAVFFHWNEQEDAVCLNQSIEKTYQLQEKIKKSDVRFNKFPGVQLIQVSKKGNYQPQILGKGFLYVKHFSLNDPLLKLIPPQLRPLILKERIAIQVNCELTRNRHTFAFEKENFHLIQQAIQMTFFSFLAQKTMEDPDFFCPGCPSDLFTEEGYQGTFKILLNRERSSLSQSDCLLYDLMKAPFLDSNHQVTSLYEKLKYFHTVTQEEGSFLSFKKTEEYQSLSMLEKKTLEKVMMSKSQNRIQRIHRNSSSFLVSFYDLPLEKQKKKFIWVKSIMNSLGIGFRIYRSSASNISGFFSTQYSGIYIKEDRLLLEEKDLIKDIAHEYAHYLEYIANNQSNPKQKEQAIICLHQGFSHQSKGDFSFYYQIACSRILKVILDNKIISAESMKELALLSEEKSDNKKFLNHSKTSPLENHHVLSSSA